MSELKSMKKILLLGMAITILIVTPIFSYESVALPRFCTLVISGTMLILLNLKILKNKPIKINRLANYLGLGFILIQVVSTVFSHTNLTDNILGISGRQIGIVANLFFLVYFLSSILVADNNFVGQLLNYLLGLGFVSSVYGLFQSFGQDPVAWINPYSPVFSFFGNPDFHSAFMGITATVALGLLLEKNSKLKQFYLGSFVLLALINIHDSLATQGYIVLLIGVITLLLKYVITADKKIQRAYISASFVALIVLILDLMQKAPWSSFLYKSSISYRGDFWRTAFRIFVDHPIFGVGPGGFRDNFRISRDAIAASRNADAGLTDSAHNYILDLVATGGIFLAMIYLAIIFLTLRATFKFLRKSNVDKQNFLILFAAWVAFQAQSLISLPQIGLTLLGWILSGTLIGFEFNSRSEQKTAPKEIRALSGFTLISVGLGFFLGSILSIPMLITDAHYRTALVRGDVLALEESAAAWPKDTIKMVYVAQLLREGKLPERSVKIARAAVSYNTQSFEAWRELSLQPNISATERTKVLATMKKLDPFNPDLK